MGYIGNTYIRTLAPIKKNEMPTATYEIDKFPEFYEMNINSENYVCNKNEYHICRFCGEKDHSLFSSIAHVVPEFTGNKQLKYFSECDKCNNKFSRYERDLSIFGGIKNTISGVKGKKYPKHIDKENSFKLTRTINELHLYLDKQTEAFKTENNRFTIESSTQKFKPRFVLKALVKIALSLMEYDELYKFKKTIEWLSTPEDSFTTQNHPMFILYEKEQVVPIPRPASMLMKKKKYHNSPEYAFIFFYSFWAYQIFIPFNSADEKLDYDDIRLPLSQLVITDRVNKEVKFNHYFMTKLENVTLNDHFERGFK